VVAAYTDGWNSRDAMPWPMLFTEDGDYTTVGGSNTHGRKDMEEMFVRLLTGRDSSASHRTDTVKRIRFVAPGIAWMDDYWSSKVLPERPPLRVLRLGHGETERPLAHCVHHATTLRVVAACR